MNKSKIFLIVIAVVAVIIVIAGQFVLKGQTETTVEPQVSDKREYIPDVNQVATSPVPTDEIKKGSVVIDFGDGNKTTGSVQALNAYDALQKVVKENGLEVSIKEYKFGLMVTKIGEKENSGQSSWSYSINGKPGQVSADKAIVYPGDKTEWTYK